ncbi:hypothetical protein SAMN03159448_04027 [Sinorhizobium sp. NFACC03]|nr:hypothetical protein SAMN03159448_04027 [Sinorhizobium sp. NFACC03]
MRKSVRGFPPASRSNLLESITFMDLVNFDQTIVIQDQMTKWRQP